MACHAHQDQVDPRKSAFKLHGGEMLTLKKIMGKSLENAELAFLSACQTATGDRKLPGEALHLAAGMLFAGYRTVIGTMWSIKDNYAPLVADEFYCHIMNANNGTLRTQDAPYALHQAVAKLREEVGVEDFETWVPFIHLGV
jgi:CHAT domain-containing protein